MKATKTIRVWDGCKVVGLFTVNKDGGYTASRSGGAEDSTQVDIEIDPWASLIVDHTTGLAPIAYQDDRE